MWAEDDAEQHFKDHDRRLEALWNAGQQPCGDGGGRECGH
jgi:hypothetical protein